MRTSGCSMSWRTPGGADSCVCVRPCVLCLPRGFLCTREQLSKSSAPQVNVCSMDHTQRIADLLAQINMFKVSGSSERLRSETPRRPLTASL